MYYYTDFNGVELPPFNPLSSSDSRPLIAPIATMSDGRGFDRLGALQAKKGAGFVQYVGTYHDEQPHIVVSKFEELEAQKGKVGWLVRRREALGTYERIYARLFNVEYTHSVTWGGRAAENIVMTFYITDPVWNGMRYGTYEPAQNKMTSTATIGGVGAAPSGAASKTVTSGSSTTLTVVNGGNAPVYGQMIEIAVAGATALSGITVTDNPTPIVGDPIHNLAYSTVIGGTGNSPRIYIDTLAKTIVDADGVGKIAGFSYGNGHNQENWLVLQPGQATTLTFAPNSGNFVAGGVTITVHYAEAWQ